MTKRRIHISVCLFAICVLSLFAGISLRQAKADSDKWIVQSIYQTSEQDGEKLFKCEQEGSAVIKYDDDLSGYNTVGARFSYQKSMAGDAQVGIQINSGSNYYLFCIMTAEVTKQAVLKYGDATIAVKNLEESVYGEIQPDVWTDIKFVLQSDYYAGYVNGKLCFKGTLSGEFKWTRAILCSWKSYNTVKGLSIYSSEKDSGEVPQPPVAQTGWTIKTLYSLGENEVYSCASEGSAVVEYLNDLSGYNTVSAKFSYQNVFADDAQVGIQINDKTSYYYFCVLTKGEQKTALLKYGDATLKSESLDVATYGELIENEYISIKFTLLSGYYAAYVNDVLCFKGATASEIAWSRALICSWKCANTVKDLLISSEKVDEPINPPAPSDWQADGNWVTEVVNGETVYSTVAYAAVINYTGSLSGINTIEADVNYKEAYAGDGYCALQVNTSKSYYLLDVAPNRPEDPVSRVRKGDNVLTRQVLTGTGFGETASGNWIHIKLVLDENYIIGYVNGVQMFKNFDTKGETLWTRALFCTWWASCSVKNLKVSHTEKQYAEVGYLDLEFKGEEAVSCFSAENAAISYSDGALKISAQSGGATIISPEINETRGQRYSALLTMQNTLLIRMKATGKVAGVKISYVTSDDLNYDEQKSKYFKLDLTDEYKPYYLNLSDTTGMSGYLRGFKAEFDGEAKEIYIDAISFEREDAVYPFSGEIAECKADVKSKIVTVKGKVSKEYAGKRVKIYRSSVQNYLESLDYADLVLETSKKTEADGTFEASFSLYDVKGRSKLAYLFLAAVDDVKVAPSFKIENYADFSEKIDRFKVNGPSVYVEEYGAKGDSYTDDTEAIQRAIDYVKSVGGGKVILGGDLSTPYGKRYIATHLRLADNMEFVIEKGATLWQSSRESDYHYERYEKSSIYDTSKPTYGHDVGINGIHWCHAGATVNFPLLYLNGLKNVRITGEGNIRMTDIGAEQPDAEYFNGNPTVNVGCTNRIHILPICVYSCENVDITDITIARSNIWHMYMSFNKNVYVANVLEKEVGCATADGFTVTSNKGVVIDRVMTYTSDDSIGICTCYDDPRGFLFRPCRPGEDNSCENITLRHSYFWGGFGVSFIPWGTGAPDSSKEEIRDVEIYDCVLGGHKSVGCWTDDPFYGSSKFDSYNGCEDNDHTPVKNIHFYDNVYLNGFEYYLGNIRLKVTNLVVEDNDDPSARSQTNFMLGSFDKVIRTGESFPDESGYVTGLSYWSYKGDKNNFGTKKIADGMGYSGYIENDGELFQGLWLNAGSYRFALKTISGKNASLFVKNSFGMLVSRKAVEQSDEFIEQTLEFSVRESGNYRIGAALLNGNGEIVYIDDADLQYIGEAEFIGEYFDEKFDGNNLLINEDICKAENGKLSMSSNERKANVESRGGYRSFDLAFNFELQKGGENSAIAFLLSDYNRFEGRYVLSLEEFAKGKHRFGVRLSDGAAWVYVDGKYVGEIEINTDKNIFFTIKLREANVDIYNVKVAPENTLEIDKKPCLVSVKNDDGLTVRFENDKTEFYYGESVSFSVDEDAEVYVNGKKIEKADGKYTFVITENSEISVKKAESKGGCNGSLGGNFEIVVLLLISCVVFAKKRLQKSKR